MIFYGSGTTVAGLTGSSRQQPSSTACSRACFAPPSKSHGAARAFQQRSQHNFSHCKKAAYFPTALGKIPGQHFRAGIIPNRADLRVNISQMISSAELKVLDSRATTCRSCTPQQAAIPSLPAGQAYLLAGCRSGSHKERLELFLSGCRAVF